MKKDDIKFLKELREEMLNQETDCQASPRFWVIKQEEREYWVDENIDGIFIYDNDECDSIFEGEFGSDEMKEWFIQFIEDRLDEKVQDVENFVDFSFKFKDNDYYFSDSKELETFLEGDCSMHLTIGYYRNIYVIKENNLKLLQLHEEGITLIADFPLEYVCVLIHGEECVNGNDCENCDYGVDENFFIED